MGGGSYNQGRCGSWPMHWTLNRASFYLDEGKRTAVVWPAEVLGGSGPGRKGGSLGYQVMGPLSEEEYAALKASIAMRGVEIPLVVDVEGEVIDGHHRRRAVAEL